MNRTEISNSIATMLLEEEIGSSVSPIDCYNYWAQKKGIRITDPDTASWTLKFIKSLLTTDKQVLVSFLSDNTEEVKR